MNAETILQRYAKDPEDLRRLRDVYNFFRGDAIASATEVNAELSDAEAVRVVASALKYHSATRDLFAYHDFTALCSALIAEAGV